MNLPRRRGFALSGRRRALAAVALLAAGLAGWLVADSFDVLIAFSHERLQAAVEDPRWQPEWGFRGQLFTALAAAALLLAARAATSAPRGVDALLPAVGLVWTLLLLRLLALLNPVTNLFPWLTLLWSPHAGWAVAGACCIAAARGLAGSGESWSNRFRQGFRALPDYGIAAAVACFAFLAYAAYGIYIGQMTMMHGDEGHYLRVTQSLLRDGDFDLSDNLGDRDVAEYHSVQFDVHKAPASPPGKIHSVHPIGLSLLLVPAYWTGLELWANPRLACILFTNLLTAASCGLAYLWLVRLRLPRFAALSSVAAAATTTPLFLYSTQLYPEIPALLAALFTLLLFSHWLLPGGGYARLPAEPVLLPFLALIPAGLVLLHPRYAPLGMLLGGLVALQAFFSTRRKTAIAGVVAAAGASLAGVLAYHFAYSGDWMGPFRPGNAWNENALDPATWLVSLPGHWLHRTKGLVNNSPVFLIAIAGLLALVRAGDRRLLVVAALYTATAGANGIHPDWEFGFCPPARFLVTALPALLPCLAAGIAASVRSATAVAACLLALTVSWDSVVSALFVPERAYDGIHLGFRKIAGFYPFSIHFFDGEITGIPYLAVSFWLGLLALSLAAGIFQCRGPRLAIAGLAALMPVAWGYSDAVGAAIQKRSSPGLGVLTEAADGGIRALRRSRILTAEFHKSETGSERDGRYSAKGPSDPPGLLASYRLPMWQRGVYRAEVPVGSRDRSEDAPHTAVVSRRDVLPVSGPWEQRLFKAMGAEQDTSLLALAFYLDRPSFGHASLLFSGAGELSLGPLKFSMLPVRLALAADEVQVFDEQHRLGSDDMVLAATDPLDQGRYLLDLRLSGSTLPALFERRAEPIFAAIFPAASGGFEAVEQTARRWFSEDRTRAEDISGFTIPVAEGVFSPAWLSLPFTGGAYRLAFSLAGTQRLLVAIKYQGDHEIRVDRVLIRKQKLRHQPRKAG